MSGIKGCGFVSVERLKKYWRDRGRCLSRREIRISQFGEEGRRLGEKNKDGRLKQINGKRVKQYLLKKKVILSSLIFLEGEETWNK